MQHVQVAGNRQRRRERAYTWKFLYRFPTSAHQNNVHEIEKPLAINTSELPLLVSPYRAMQIVSRCRFLDLRITSFRFIGRIAIIIPSSLMRREYCTRALQSTKFVSAYGCVPFTTALLPALPALVRTPDIVRQYSHACISTPRHS